MRLARLGGMLCIWAGVAGAQTAAGAAPPGRLVRRATAANDTVQHFAIYYPSSYAVTRKWPVIFVMDPRGRAMLGIDLFSPAAERYGYILVSSYNTLSDGAIDPNIGAINAMLEVAHDSMAADMSRLYIAGFSGTARLGWGFEQEAPKNFAGMFAAGASPAVTDPASLAMLRAPGFAMAMTAGTTDFNFSEVHGADLELRRRGIPARVSYFDGPHGWPPAPLVDRAVAWFELRAMLGGKRAIDSAWVREQLAADTQRAADLEIHGRWAAAADAYADVALGFAGWPGATSAAAHAKTLDDRTEVATLRQRLAQLDSRQNDRALSTLKVLTEVRRATSGVDAERLARALRLAELKALAASGDSVEGAWATRVLANAQVMLGFYEPRAYLEQKDGARAVLMLAALATIGPLQPQHCALLAQASAMLTERERAKLPACGG